MKPIFENFRKFLKEIKSRWEFDVLVRLEKDANLYADIFEKIRAIPGVTIVKTGERQKNISSDQMHCWRNRNGQLCPVSQETTRQTKRRKR